MFGLIDGRTQLVGLIGWPVEHSLSPAMHNAAFESLGLNWRYVPLPVAPGQVATALRGLVALGFKGANVTVPHKSAVLPELDAVAPEAGGLGAVNTVVIGRDADNRARLTGHNTDLAGFIGALQESGFEPEGRSVVVVGAGGGARGVVYGLMEAGVGRIVVLNRTTERAAALISDLGGVSKAGAAPEPPTLEALPLDSDALTATARAADLLVNTTSVGMWPDVDASIWPEGEPIPPGLTVFDLVYSPRETKLVRQARRSGAQAIDGLGMLVLQGALSFELWTGLQAPVEVMRKACRRSLHSAGGC
ncbi:MAG: shikimate dehydrogenase [Anaerolineae bacterium]|jgi:shikimate dehydrogenase